ncbi:MAG: porin family protein [Bacteroidales bacterium]
MKSTNDQELNNPVNILRVALLLLALMLFTPAFPQIFRAKGGVNLTAMYPRDSYEHSSIKYPPNPGLHLGSTIEMPISRRYSIESGLFLSTKGYKRRNTQYTSVLTYTMKTDINFVYLEVPILAKATIKRSGKKYFAQAGPYLGLAILGNYVRATVIENDTQSTTTTDKGKIEWISEGGDYQRLDYGLMVGGGVEIRSVNFGLTYGLGLARNKPDYRFESHQRNHVIGLSAGYRFN